MHENNMSLNECIFSLKNINGNNIKTSTLSFGIIF